MEKMEKSTNSIDLVYKEIVVEDILAISNFLNGTFKTTKFKVDYLQNLYFKYDSAIGYNVFKENRIIAHYCVVRRIYNHEGREYEIGWSLNTAVDKEFRGRGFFLDLATRSYRLALKKGIVAIVGVANRNSTRLFLEKLGFEDRGTIKWNVDLLVTYRERKVFPNSFSHIRTKNFGLRGNLYLLLYPIIKIYSSRKFSFFSLYLTNRQQHFRLGFSLPQDWFKSNWQVITLNLHPKDSSVSQFLQDFTIDIAESDTF
jgi:RimJ/RimL family protein N-acetyltransferase